MECLKDCCKNFMNKKGRDQDTQGKVEFCTAAYQTALTECVVPNWWISFAFKLSH